MADFRPSDTKCRVCDKTVEETGNELSEKCAADEKMAASARQSTPRHTNQVPAHEATRDSLQTSWSAKQPKAGGTTISKQYLVGRLSAPSSFTGADMQISECMAPA